jgi:hypothetical protein
MQNDVEAATLVSEVKDYLMPAEELPAHHFAAGNKSFFTQFFKELELNNSLADLLKHFRWAVRRAEMKKTEKLVIDCGHLIEAKGPF